MGMRRFIVGVIGIALFCWATVSAFSIFSELKFLVDGWTWSIDQVPISIKAIALAVGKYVSGIVGGYREFVRGLVQMLHLPRLPQPVYDAVGIVTFSMGRGYWIAKQVVDNGTAPRFGAYFRRRGHRFIVFAIALFIVCSSAVASVLAVLFGIDFLYRHFA